MVSIEGKTLLVTRDQGQILADVACGFLNCSAQSLSVFVVLVRVNAVH